MLHGGSRPWADPAAISSNRLAMRPAGMVPCPDLATARDHLPESSPWWLSLDGEWDFELLERPEQLEPSHLIGAEPGSAASGATAVVPGAWTMQGHGHPIYTNVVMPFSGEPPAVPEDNPTAVYRRDFEIPAHWSGRRVVLSVGSAESMVFVFVDGQQVGFSTDSRLPAEFELGSATLGEGRHQLALVVPRWSASSWLEDQDQWWHGGLQRSVSLHCTAETYLATAALVPGLRSAGVSRVVPANRERIGTLDIELGFEGAARTQPGWSAEVHVETLRGRRIASTGEHPLAHWDDSSVIAEMAGAMLTEPGRIRAQLEVPAIEAWSAESPKLYRAVVTLRDPSGSVVEVDALRIGFRSVRVRDRQLLINDAPVILRGVNLHEHDPGRGRAVTADATRVDLEMIKAANLNAVRAAHYPHAEHFAQLCDELGLYVVDEANVESHARQWSLCNEGMFDLQVIQRNVRMAQRDMHHPCVVMWSLGNESGYGPGHDAAAAALRRIDPSRPLHYEGPFMYDLDAEAPVSDVVCPMYSTVPEIVRWAENARDPRRPLILCEYSHAMGNACGGLADYDEAFETHEGLQGGFIWEWCEHAIPTPDGARGPDGAPSWGYAGDFGDGEQEGNFVLDGLVGADRRAHPVLDEVRYLGRPVRAELLASSPGRADVELTNQRWFTDTSDLSARWELTADGEVVAGGELTGRPIRPRRSIKTVLRWRSALQHSGAEFHLNLRWELASRTSWAPGGHRVGWDQFSLADPGAPRAREMFGTPTSVASPNAKRDEPPGDAAPTGLGGLRPLELTPTVFRALTDNDGISAGWMRGFNGSLARWVDELGLDRCSWDPESGLLQPASKVPPVQVRARLSDAGDGWQRLRVGFALPRELADPPRLGFTWQLPANLEHLEFFADGPSDCYPDRRAGATAQRWRSTVSDQYVDYGMPQGHGHHTGLRWLTLRRGRRGTGLMVVLESTSNTDGLAVGFSARHHGDDELWNARHTGDLTAMQAAAATWLSVDVAQRGLGQSSLGPETAEPYRIPAGDHEITLLLRGLRNRDDAGELFARTRVGPIIKG